MSLWLGEGLGYIGVCLITFYLSSPMRVRGVWGDTAKSDCLKDGDTLGQTDGRNVLYKRRISLKV